jgi:hypothetical protein
VKGERTRQQRNGCRGYESRSLVGACARQDGNSFAQNHPPAG